MNGTNIYKIFLEVLIHGLQSWNRLYPVRRLCC